ncbi:MAG: hypothetical protein ACYCU5_16055, partial [Actinomycetes bacterium]
MSDERGTIGLVAGPDMARQPEASERREDVRTAAMRPVLETPRWWWPAVGVLSAIVALGILAWVVQVGDGLGVAGYNSQAFWAVYEADLVAF